MNDADYLVFKAIAKILIRRGLIDQDEIDSAVEDLERSGFGDAAHNLTFLAIEAQSMTASEFQAEQRRRRMVEQTAYINRKPDDGKPAP